MLGDIEGGVVAYVSDDLRSNLRPLLMRSSARTHRQCLNETWGARPLPSTAIKGLQYLRTPSYVQIIGSLDLTALGYAADDSGGERELSVTCPECAGSSLTPQQSAVDPHGADLLGNPVGMLLAMSRESAESLRSCLGSFLSYFLCCRRIGLLKSAAIWRQFDARASCRMEHLLRRSHVLHEAL